MVCRQGDLREFSVRVFILDRRRGHVGHVGRVIALANTVAAVRILQQGIVWRLLPMHFAPHCQCLRGTLTRFTEFEQIAKERAEEG